MEKSYRVFFSSAQKLPLAAPGTLVYFLEIFNLDLDQILDTFETTTERDSKFIRIYISTVLRRIVGRRDVRFSSDPILKVR